MAIQFTRVSDNLYGFPNGSYKAYISNVENIQMGNEKSLSFTWLILEPSEFRGRQKWENFTLVENMNEVPHDLKERRIKEQEKFNIFWSQMSDNESGVITDEEINKILHKEAILDMKNYTFEDGRTVTSIRKRTLVSKIKKEAEVRRTVNLLDDSSSLIDL